MQKLGMGDGEAIEHPWVTRSIENAQRKVEGRNFDIRKEILAYDDVANDQRKVIYAQRNELMAANDISDIITAIREDVVNNVITQLYSTENHGGTMEYYRPGRAFTAGISILTFPLQKC